MDDFSYGDEKKLRLICENLLKPETQTEDDLESRLIDLENLENHMEILDMTQTFYNIGGFPILIDTMLKSGYKEV